jgi:hypothetical protein
MTTKDKVAKLKEDLKKRKAILRGEIDQNTEEEVEKAEGEEDDIKIDTSKQENQ